MAEIKQIPFGKPLIGKEEQRAVKEVLSGPILVHGEQSKEFELLCIQCAMLSVSCGWHALDISRIGLWSWRRSNRSTGLLLQHAVALTGAKPVFVDAESRTGNIYFSNRILNFSENSGYCCGSLPRRPVVYGGSTNIANKLVVLEDCALCWCFEGVHWLAGDTGCFSFYPVKHLTTAEGGMVILKDKALADKIRLLKALGSIEPMAKMFRNYDVVGLGYNYRMSEVHTAIGIEQMKKLPDFLESRRETTCDSKRALGINYR